LQIHGRFEVMETDAFYACVIDSRAKQQADFTAANERLKNRRLCVDETGNSSVALAVQMLIEAVELAECQGRTVTIQAERLDASPVCAEYLG
jgi:hypothetical protein